MKLDIKFLVLSFFLSVSIHHAFASSIEDIIKEAAKKNNYLPSSALINEQDDGLANVGEKLFDSHSLSLNGETPCRSCHLEEFSSRRDTQCHRGRWSRYGIRKSHVFGGDHT